MKVSKQCPKCHGRRIGYIAEQVDADELTAGGPQPTTSRPLARSVAHGAAKVDTGFWQRGEVFFLYGTLEAYVCADCGYHESYVKDVGSVPWERLAGFLWVNPPEGGPFR